MNDDLQKHLVSDLMIPINDYPTLSADATLADGLNMLMRRPTEAMNFGFRRVLVLDNDGRMKGILTIPLLLKGMEPALLTTSPGDTAEGYWADGDAYSGAAVEVFWDEVLKSPCHELVEKPLGQLVKLPEKMLAPDTPLARALVYLLAQETNMLPVLEDERVVAVLRLVDVFNMIAKKITGCRI